VSRRRPRVPGTPDPRQLRRALRGLDGGPQLHAALDQLPGRGGYDVIVVDNGGRGPMVIDTRARPPGGWLLEGALPTGVVAALCDLDDPTPPALLENGFDVVLQLAGRGAMTDRPVLLTVHWRDGLLPGLRPPAPFWVRFDAAAGGFVRVVEEPEAA
jgi:hypothetical protein